MWLLINPFNKTGSVPAGGADAVGLADDAYSIVRTSPEYAAAVGASIDPTVWSTAASVAAEYATAIGYAYDSVVKVPGYTYFRLIVDAVKSAGNYVQLSEFELCSGGTYLSGATYANGNGSSPGGEGPDAAGDGSLGSKWLNFQGAGSILTVTYSSPQVPTSYKIGTANDSGGRDPYSWRVQGSVDGSTWITLDTQTSVYVTDSRNTWAGEWTVLVEGDKSFNADYAAAAIAAYPPRFDNGEQVVATGGTIVDADGYRTHTFTMAGGASQSFVIYVGGEIEYMVVGGGGGGDGNNRGSAGGGGGAMAYGTLVVNPTTYALTIGTGGPRTALWSPGNNGTDSSIAGVAVAGGGVAGGRGNTGGVVTLGSGYPGGAGGWGTDGYAGPIHPIWGQYAGGGGYGSSGGYPGTAGGAGGGGHGAWDWTWGAADAVADTGSGGGGGSGNGDNNGAGANGIIKIRYPHVPVIEAEAATAIALAYNASIAEPPIVTSGLVWHLDGKQYTAGTTTWADLSGSGKDVTLTSAPTYDDTVGSLDFAASVYGYAASVGSLSNWTAEAWFTNSSRPGNNACVMSDYYPSYVNWKIGMEPNGYVYGGWFNGGWHTGAAYGPTLNTWSHMVVTYDGNVLTTYVNGGAGSPVTTGGGGGSSSGTQMRVGRRWDGDERWPGKIGQVRLYNRALSAAEVAQNFEARRVRYGVASPNATVNMESISITGLADDATITITSSTNTNVDADVAAAGGAVDISALALTASAETAAAAVAADDAVVQEAVVADLAAGSANGQDASVTLIDTVSVVSADATSAAANATALVGVTAEDVTATGSADDASAVEDTRAVSASAASTAVADASSVEVGATAADVVAAGSADDTSITAASRAAVEVAQGSAAADTATLGVAVPSEASAATGAADNTTESVKVSAECATAAGSANNPAIPNSTVVAQAKALGAWF